MDNVLIDDRRIHVDFSQSVAKMKWDMFKKSKCISHKFECKLNLLSYYLIYDRRFGLMFLYSTIERSKTNRSDNCTIEE